MEWLSPLHRPLPGSGLHKQAREGRRGLANLEEGGAAASRPTSACSPTAIFSALQHLLPRLPTPWWPCSHSRRAWKQQEENALRLHLPNPALVITCPVLTFPLLSAVTLRALTSFCDGYRPLLPSQEHGSTDFRFPSTPSARPSRACVEVGWSGISSMLRVCQAGTTKLWSLNDWPGSRSGRGHVRE